MYNTNMYNVPVICKMCKVPVHSIDGSPMKPGGHVQRNPPSTLEQSAFLPQTDGDRAHSLESKHPVV